MDATQLGSGPMEYLFLQAQFADARRRTGGASGTRASQVAVDIEPAASRRQAEDLWNCHGRRAYALALALLGDDESAMRAVALGMTDFARSDTSTAADESRRSLARHVYWRCTQLRVDTPSMLRPLPSMRWLAQLQRTCLALCVFGGHSYSQAADLLGVPAETVAGMLTSGLQELGRLNTGRVAISG